MEWKKLNRLKFLILALVISSCATMVPPQGGPVDEQPPIVVESDPPNGTVNFKPQKVKITFNEFIQLSDIQNQVLISPPMKDKPVFQRRGKSMVFQVPDSLREKTTYSIFFGSSVADITEGNEISNYKYIFSTGNHLDSMILTGHAHIGLSHKTEAGWTIMLYKEVYDSIPMKEVPFYVSKTDEKGYFTFENLAPGRYKIFGLIDQNKNYLYDLPNEMIAFSDSLVSPVPPASLPDSLLSDSAGFEFAEPDSLMHEKNPGNVRLTFFNETDSVQELLDAAALNPFIYRISLKYPSRSLSLEIKDFENYFSKLNEIKDTVELFFSKKVTDSLMLVLSDPYYSWTDTTWIVPTKDKPAKVISNLSQGPLPYFRDITFSSEIPFYAFDKNSFILTETRDSITDTISNIHLFFRDTIRKQRLILDYQWNNERKYALTLLPGAFTLADSTVNDTLHYEFSIKLPEKYGNIIFELKNRDTAMNYIIQLLNTSDEIISQIRRTKNKTVEFSNLIPGDYKIRVIEDRNNNGFWNTGHYIKGIQPERSWFFHKTFNVRANWDVKEEMDLQKAGLHQ